MYSVVWKKRNVKFFNFPVLRIEKRLSLNWASLPLLNHTTIPS